MKKHLDFFGVHTHTSTGRLAHADTHTHTNTGQKKIYWKMSRLPNLTHVNRKGEQKALWKGRKTHICVRWKKNSSKKTEKETDFKAPTAHGDRKWKGRGFDRVSLWGLLSEHRAEDGGVCVCNPYGCLYMSFVCLKSVCVLSWQGLQRKGPLLQRWQTSSGLSVCCVGDDSYLNRGVYATQQSMRGRRDGGQCCLLLTNAGVF